jgi:LysR family transcriptional regulator, glycine cleavage system transcriptional activator
VGRQITLIAPAKDKAAQALRKVADVAKHPLLQHVSAPGEWGRWCAALGVKHVAPNAGPVLDQYTSLIRAVMAGMGLALVPHCLVAEDIEAGLVSAPFAGLASFESAFGYYLCYPPVRAQIPALAAFREWILQACKDEIAA